MNSISRKKLSLELLCMVILSGLGFLIYSHTLHSPFVFDDWASIQVNPSIRMESLSWDSIENAAFGSAQKRRPVPYLSFALNYYFHRFELPGYHLVNISIHLLTGIIIFYFFKTTLHLAFSRQSSNFSNVWIAGAAALVWLVHPLHVQSVTFVVQRINTLAVFFYMLTLLFYVRARMASGRGIQILLFAGSVVSAVTAFGCKEIAYTLPLFILLYEWFFLQDLKLDLLRKHGVLLTVIGVAAILLILHLTDYQPLAFVAAEYAKRDFTMLQRLLTESRVIMFYLSLLFFPHPSRLNIDHDFPLSESFLDPLTTLLAFGLLLTLFAFGIKTARQERLLSFGILWFFGNLALESTVIGIEIIYEHRTYLPSVMVALAVVVLVDRHIKRPGIKTVLLVLSVALLAGWTYQRNAVWQDELTLFRDSLAKSPFKARVHANLAYALENNNEFEAALVHYQKALDLNPSRKDELDNIYYNYGNLLYKLDRFSEAADYLRRAMQVNPESLMIRNNLAYALAKQGKIEEASEVLQELLRIFPGNARAHNDLGVYLLRLGKIASAEYHFKEALRLGYGPSRLNLINIKKLRSTRQRSRSFFDTSPDR